MKHIMLAGAMVLTVLSAGCATKKYVAQTVAPVETHVANVESKNDAKNAEQDKTIAGQGQQIQDLDRSLSQTKEKLSDTDAKAVSAGQSAQQANQAAQEASQAAGRAQQSADGARTFADQGLTGALGFAGQLAPRLFRQLPHLRRQHPIGKFQVMIRHQILNGLDFKRNGNRNTDRAHRQKLQLSG